MERLFGQGKPCACNGLPVVGHQNIKHNLAKTAKNKHRLERCLLKLLQPQV